MCAMLLWFAAGWWFKRKAPPSQTLPSFERTPLHQKIKQMLHEAWVVLPGATGILGFQLMITTTAAFKALEPGIRLLHFVALALIASTLVLLLTPAAIHRKAFGGALLSSAVSLVVDGGLKAGASVAGGAASIAGTGAAGAPASAVGSSSSSSSNSCRISSVGDHLRSAFFRRPKGARGPPMALFPMISPIVPAAARAPVGVRYPRPLEPVGLPLWLQMKESTIWGYAA